MKKTKYAVLLGLVGLTSLASCGGGGTTNVDQPLPKDDPTSEVEIQFWHCLGQAKAQEVQIYVDQFNNQYKGKYKVVASALAGGYDELHTALKSKLADGKVPGLTMGYPDSFSEYMGRKMSNSSILRLDSWINDPDYGYTAEEMNDFIPGFLAEGTNYQFEGTWSFPMYKSTEVLYYNVDIFNGFNEENAKKFKGNAQYEEKFKAVTSTMPVTDPVYQDYVNWIDANGGYLYDVPETWQEMFIVAAEMQANRREQGIPESAFWPVGYDSDANLMISQMYQRGIPYTSLDENNHFLFNNYDAKALTYELKDLIDRKLLITKGKLGGKTYTNSYFTAGQIAMTIGSTGGSTYNNSTNFRVGVVPAPVYYDVDKAQKKVAYIQQGPSICFFDNENGYIHKGSWLFYKFLADKNNNVEIALENSYDAVRKSCYQTDTYSKWVAKKDLGLKYMIPTVTSQMTEGYFTSPTFFGSAVAREEMGKILDMVCNQKLSIDDAFSSAYNTCIDFK